VRFADLLQYREREVMESSESSEDESDGKPSTPIGSKNVKHDLMVKSEVWILTLFFLKTDLKKSQSFIA
jgi:hypothetical protein